MAEKKIYCDITEYSVVTPHEEVILSFSIGKEFLRIDILNSEGKIIKSTETSIEDALELADFIQKNKITMKKDIELV